MEGGGTPRAPKGHGRGPVPLRGRNRHGGLDRRKIHAPQNRHAIPFGAPRAPKGRVKCTPDTLMESRFSGSRIPKWSPVIFPGSLPSFGGPLPAASASASLAAGRSLSSPGWGVPGRRAQAPRGRSGAPIMRATRVDPLKCSGCGGTAFGRRTCQRCGKVPDWMTRYRQLSARLRKVRSRAEPEGDLVQRKLEAYWAMTPDERRYAESDRPLPPRRPAPSGS